nr:ABC-2 transporter permease [uncultured Sellimonas sp.]
MKGLLVKDLCLMRELKKTVLIIVFVSAVFVFSGTDQAFLTGYIIILSAFIAGMTLSYDEMNNGMAFLMTLPCSRKQYVAEKYLFGLLIIAIGVVYSGALAVIQNMVGSDSGMKEVLLTTEICAFVGAIMLAVLLPTNLKFGAEKGRIMLILGIMIVCFGIFFGVRILESNFPDQHSAMIQWMNEALMSRFIYPVFIILGIGALGISFLIACRILEKKEF